MIGDFLMKRYGLVVRVFDRMEGGVMNENYRVQTDQGLYVCKIYRSRSAEEVLYEVGVLGVLDSIHFPCPVFYKGVDGNVVQVFDGRPAVVYEFIEGDVLRDWDEQEMSEVGRLMGVMHRELFDVPQTVERDCWEQDRVWRIIDDSSDVIRQRGFDGAELFLSEIAAARQKLPFFEGLPIGTTHQDVKPRNIIRGNTGLTLIDFDNMHRGALLVDAMTPLMWMCFSESGWNQEYVHAFMYSYEHERPMTDDEKKVLHQALMYRCIREAFVWPYRFDGEEAWQKGQFFLDAYKQCVTLII